MNSRFRGLLRLSPCASFALVAWTGVAGAQPVCPKETAEVASAYVLLAGKMICAKDGTDRWQEEHLAGAGDGGDLWDYKLGDGHPVDPRAKVGTWNAQRTGPLVAYSYGSGSNRWRICQVGVGSTYTLMSNQRTITGATIKATGSACPP
jgi:hypothetical protein